MYMSERVAIVTGASSGAAIARMFAEAGIKTVLAARSADKLEATAIEIRDTGCTALICATDITQETQVINLFESTIATYGRADILVNDAGLADHMPTVDFDLGRVAALDRCDAHPPVAVRAQGNAGHGEAEAQAHEQRQRVVAPAAPHTSDLPQRNSVFTPSRNRWLSMVASMA
jgi:NAD(P)-dependent dehydrogenase (short-subunit alcohol dehydrogenase family)